MEIIFEKHDILFTYRLKRDLFYSFEKEVMKKLLCRNVVIHRNIY